MKRVAKEIAKPLTMICNLSISTGTVPDKLIIAKVIPIFHTYLFFQIIDQCRSCHVFQDFRTSGI